MPSWEMPYSARDPSAVAVFIASTIPAHSEKTASPASAPGSRMRSVSRHERVDVGDVEILVAEGAHGAHRQEAVGDHAEDGRHAQRLRRVARGVVVLRRERGAALHPVGRPAHRVQPDDDQREAARPQRVRRRTDVVVHVGAVPVAGQVGQEHHHRERQHQQRAGDVADPDGRPHPRHVERPDDDDDQRGQRDREAEVDGLAEHRPGVVPAGRGRRRRIPLVLDEEPDHDAGGREHHDQPIQ